MVGICDGKMGMVWLGYGKSVINNDEMQNMNLLLLQCFS